MPYAWKLELPGDCNTDLPWRNGILGTGLFIGPPGSPFADGKPHQGLFGRDAADDGLLEASNSALLIAPGEYTMWAYGSCVSRSNSAVRVEFETPHTTFFVKARLSTVKIRSQLRISDIRSKGIDLFLTCGANCTSATFVAKLSPGGKVLGSLSRSAPADQPAPFLPLPSQPPLRLKLTAAAKTKLAKLKTASIKITATVKLADGETQAVTATAKFAR